MSNLAKNGWEISNALSLWRDESDSPQIDAQVKIVTAENIAFNYDVAGPFRRLMAYLLDLCLVAGFLVALGMIFSLLLTLLMLVLGFMFGVTSFETTQAFSSIMTGYYFVIVFLANWFYGILFETFWSGQTFGKWMLGLRAVSTDGQPINAAQATLRNFIRGADAFPLLSPALFAGVLPQLPGDAQWSDLTPLTIMPTFMVGFFAMLLTRRYQRVGDVIAGTMVVLEERSWLMGVARVEDARTPHLAALIPPKFQVSRDMAQALAIYVERRRFFSLPRRKEIAQHLGEPLLRIFNMPPDTSHDLLLCALYYRTFVADTNDDGEAWAAYSQPQGVPAAVGVPQAIAPHAGQPAPAVSSGVAFVPPGPQATQPGPSPPGGPPVAGRSLGPTQQNRE